MFSTETSIKRHSIKRGSGTNAGHKVHECDVRKKAFTHASDFIRLKRTYTDYLFFFKTLSTVKNARLAFSAGTNWFGLFLVAQL